MVYSCMNSLWLEWAPPSGGDGPSWADKYLVLPQLLVVGCIMVLMWSQGIQVIPMFHHITYGSVDFSSRCQYIFSVINRFQSIFHWLNVHPRCVFYTITCELTIDNSSNLWTLWLSMGYCNKYIPILDTTLLYRPSSCNREWSISMF